MSSIYVEVVMWSGIVRTEGEGPDQIGLLHVQTHAGISFV